MRPPVVDIRMTRALAAMIVLTAMLPPATALARGTGSFTGTASYYSADYHGRVASGSQYDPQKFTAAHKTLPFGTRVRVNCPKTGRSIIVIINDRGPFSPGRVLDLSYAAAQALHMIGRGLVKVEAQVE
jgi:peptidoglycan lytic transglycosylase